MSYLTDRFKHDEPSWQFVLWTRQAILFLDATLARRFIESGSSIGEGVNSTFTPNSTTFAEGDVTSGLLDSSNWASVLAMWVHVAVALLTLMVFWAFHERQRPYEYGFQNAMCALART